MTPMNVHLEMTQIEVPVRRRGRRATYRWVPAAYLVVDGLKQYPPMRLHEAKRALKEALSTPHTMKEHQDRAQNLAMRRASLEDRIARLLPLVASGDRVAARSVRSMRRELASLS